MIIYNKFKLKQSVYLLDDPHRIRHTVVAIIVKEGHLKYEISYCGTVTEVHEYELTKEKEADRPEVEEEDDEDEE